MNSHAAHVLAVASSSSAAAKSRLAASWVRSINKYGLDPGSTSRPDRLDSVAFNSRQKELRGFLRHAAPRLDQLFAIVGKSGSAAALTDAQGVVMVQRCTSGDEVQFKEWGLWEGARLNEAIEGTNGIGTCLAEERQMIVHRQEHFFARNIGISCVGAPIFGPDGTVFGALDVSSARNDQTPSINRMISALVKKTAQDIEADLFRTRYNPARIITLSDDALGSIMMLAVDCDDLVVGASRSARKHFGLDVGATIAPIVAQDVLEPDTRNDDIGFDRTDRMALVQALAKNDNNASEAARHLGIGRATFYRRMRDLKIKR